MNYVRLSRFIQLVTYFCYVNFDYTDVHTGMRNKRIFSSNVSKLAVSLKTPTKYIHSLN
jgi:hypothetical protein